MLDLVFCIFCGNILVSRILCKAAVFLDPVRHCRGQIVYFGIHIVGLGVSLLKVNHSGVIDFKVASELGYFFFIF